MILVRLVRRSAALLAASSSAVRLVEEEDGVRGVGEGGEERAVMVGEGEECC